METWNTATHHPSYEVFQRYAYCSIPAMQISTYMENAGRRPAIVTALGLSALLLVHGRGNANHFLTTY